MTPGTFCLLVHESQIPIHQVSGIPHDSKDTMPANTLDLHPKPTLPAAVPVHGASERKTTMMGTATMPSQEPPKKKKTYISKESRVYAYMR
jgi:hypothetical protein